MIWVIEVQTDQGEWLPWDDGCFLTRELAREHLATFKKRHPLMGRVRRYVRAD